MVTKMRICGCASSWGFYAISITTVRFEYLARHRGYDPEQIAEAALAASVLSTLLLLPDVALVPRQWNLAKANLVARAEEAPQKKYSQGNSSKSARAAVRRLTWWHTLAIVLGDNIPELVVTSLYYTIVGFDATDEIAMTSLVLTAAGTALNIVIISQWQKSPLLAQQVCK